MSSTMSSTFVQHFRRIPTRIPVSPVRRLADSANLRRTREQGKKMSGFCSSVGPGSGCRVRAADRLYPYTHYSTPKRVFCRDEYDRAPAAPDPRGCATGALRKRRSVFHQPYLWTPNALAAAQCSRPSKTHVLARKSRFTTQPQPYPPSPPFCSNPYRQGRGSRLASHPWPHWAR